MGGFLGQLIGSFGGRFINLTNHTVGDTEPSPTNAQASIALSTAGALTFTGNDSDANPTDEWNVPQVTPGHTFYVRLTSVGDAPTSGDTTGTWLALSSARSWTWTTSADGSLTIDTTLAIASDAAGANILDSCAIGGSVTRAI